MFSGSGYKWKIWNWNCLPFVFIENIEIIGRTKMADNFSFVISLWNNFKYFCYIKWTHAITNAEFLAKKSKKTKLFSFIWWKINISDYIYIFLQLAAPRENVLYIKCCAPRESSLSLIIMSDKYPTCKGLPSWGPNWYVRINFRMKQQ